MSSAAIIGRQLRQQQSSSRISGPVVPPTQYKGRVITPSPVPQQQQHSHHSHPHPAQSQDSICSSVTVPYCRASLVASLATESSSPKEFLAPSSAYLTPALIASLNQSNNHRPLGADVDKKFAQFSRLYSHDFYPHPAHRENAQEKAAAAAKEKKRNEPKLRCTRHCFCIAFKALSSGIILFVAGAIMSVIGFYADSMAAEEMRQQNNNNISNAVTASSNGNNEDSDENNSSSSGVDGKSNYHNLTYLGPLIMGLGAIVLLAACVLTFEVRDTLGVKEQPQPVEEIVVVKKKKKEDVIIPKYDDSNNKSVSVIDDHSANLLSSYLSQTLRNDKVKPRMVEETSQVNQIIITTDQPLNLDVHNKNYHRHHHRHRHRHRQHQQRNLVTEQQANTNVIKLDQPINYAHVLEEAEDITPTGYDSKIMQFSNVSTPSTLVNMPLGQNITPPKIHSDALKPHEGSCSSIDHSYLRIPSPQDLELSDPDGCSLMSRYYRQARCSCTGSPTSSNTIALAIENIGQGSSYSYYDQKMLASIESDGLSSTTSSEWETGFKMKKTKNKFRHDHFQARDNGPFMPSNSISQLSISTIKSDQLLNDQHHYRSVISATQTQQQQQQQQQRATLLTSRAQSYDRVYQNLNEHCYPILNLPEPSQSTQWHNKY